jgi:hypothetical protein
MPSLHANLSGQELVTYRTADGAERVLAAKDAVDVSLEYADPSRTFPAWPGKRAKNGLLWCATTCSLVGFESGFERDHLLALDHDPSITAISSQPMWIHWPRGSIRESHCPDYFARDNDGDGIVIDVRPERLVGDDQALFDRTRELCSKVGWRYRLLTQIDDAYATNLRWLHAYAHPRNRPPANLTETILITLGTGTELAVALGRLGTPPHLALLYVYHLLWTQSLVAALDRRLTMTSIISAGYER